jgi:hypothetical protein
MEKAAAFFGHAKRPGDLRVQLIRAGEGGRPGVLAEGNEYSRAAPDRGGVLRRIMPVKAVPDLSDENAGEKLMEHIIYAALKPRFENSGIEHKEAGPVLAITNSPKGPDRMIPLDSSGALIFEVPHKGEDFRRIGISDFLSYDEADRSYRRLLLEAEALGVFRGIEGEKHPGILYDYALSIRETLASTFQNGNEEKKLLWAEARNNFFKSLEDFLYGPAEMKLVGGYEEIIASELLGTLEAAKMTEMRNSLIQTFNVLRSKCNEVLDLRKKLESALASSFCILGNTQDVEASALLANSILTGRVVKPGEKRHLLFGSLLAGFLVCFLIKSLKPSLTLWAGMLISLLSGIGFSLWFIFTGTWLDPYVPFASGGMGALFSSAWAFASRSRYSRSFRQAFGPFVSRACLKSVIQAGKPLPSQILTCRAAVVAIRCSAPDDLKESYTQALLSFREKAAELIKKAGGAIAGIDEDMVTACFGSPLERVFLKNAKKPSQYEDKANAGNAPSLKAIDFVTDVLSRKECGAWRFGLDAGDCTFTWTAASGYFVLGPPALKAKMLSRMAGRHKSQVVISAGIYETLPSLKTKRLGVIKGKDLSGEEAFYKLDV